MTSRYHRSETHRPPIHTHRPSRRLPSVKISTHPYAFPTGYAAFPRQPPPVQTELDYAIGYMPVYPDALFPPAMRTHDGHSVCHPLPYSHSFLFLAALPDFRHNSIVVACLGCSPLGAQPNEYLGDRCCKPHRRKNDISCKNNFTRIQKNDRRTRRARTGALFLEDDPTMGEQSLRNDHMLGNFNEIFVSGGTGGAGGAGGIWGGDSGTRMGPMVGSTDLGTRQLDRQIQKLSGGTGGNGGAGSILGGDGGTGTGPTFNFNFPHGLRPTPSV